MTGILFKWLVPGAVTVVAGAALALTGSAMASDLATQSLSALQSMDGMPAKASIAGQSEAAPHSRLAAWPEAGSGLALVQRAPGVSAVRVAQAAPQELPLGANVPLASPYVWSAVKAETGSVTIAGYVPDVDTQTLLAAHVANLVADTSTIADGAPAGFGASARKGFDILALLDSGSVVFDGTAWAIAGTVSTPQKGFAADAAYSVAGLRTAGWSYDVHLAQPPVAAALPVATPFVWRAVKAVDGKVGFSGYAPSDAFREFARVRAPGVTDQSTLAGGAPDNFGVSAAAGLEALLALDSGALALDGDRWSLSGEVADETAGEAIKRTLAAKVDLSDWQVAIDSPVPEVPVMSPYLWAADKTSNGEVSLSGYLPTPDLQAVITARAGRVVRESLSIAAGEPADFAADVMAGLAALEQLEFGRVAFDGQGWTLAGEAASEAARDAAMAALSHDGKLDGNWTVSVSVSATAIPAPVDAPDIVTREAPAASVPATPEPEAEPAASDAGAAPAIAEAIDMPPTLVFSAERAADGKISLAGSVPAAATAAYFGVIAGGAPTAGLKATSGLPEDFIANGTAGIEALAELGAARLGFDGTRWWLRGEAEQQKDREAALAKIAALPDGKGWSVAIEVMAPLAVCRARVAELAGRNAILFETGKSVLTKSSLAVLDELASDLDICSDTFVHVQGHTDSDGDTASNLALSVSRAEAVVAELVRRGVDDGRLYAEGFGASDPIVANDSKDNKARNRRITLAISPK